MKHSFKRALAIMLSILLMTSNLGLTAFAEDFISVPDDSVLIDEEELFSSDGSSDDLFLGEVYSEDIEAPVEEAEPILLGDIDLEETDGLTIEPEQVPEESFGEAPAVPFDQDVTLDGVTFAVTADAGVFPEDSVLRVQKAENAAITEAAEKAIGAVGIYIHRLYTIEVLDAAGNVILPDFEMGTPAVRVEGLNLPENARVALYDDYAQAAYEISADVDTEADFIEFNLVDMTVYDILTVEPISEQSEEPTEQPADEKQDQTTEGEAAEGDPTIEDQAEELAKQPVEEAQAVAVVFDAIPETAVIMVYPVATEEAPIPVAIPAEEDGSFLLLPGEYTYSAEAEGYVPVETMPFTVTGDEQPLMVSFELEAVVAVEEQPVSVIFDATPETAVITVYPAATEEVPEPEAIPAEEDGSFLLLPGEYTYTAKAEGFVSAENIPFTVADEPLTLSVVLEAVEAEPMAFDQSKTVDGVIITVKADPGVFPANAALSVKRVPVKQRRAAEDAIDEIRDEDQNVAVSYTFDIKVINPDTGEEYQPAEGQTVNVSFALAEVADENLETQVYHVTEEETTGELTAEALDVTTEVTPETGEETTAVVETDGFSIYQVEFTYNKLEYVLPGDSSVAMSEILSTLGLTGEVTAVEISDTSLFSASNESGEWIVTALQPFSTTEWMKVTINGVVYEITVTDTATSTINVGDTDYTLFTGFTATNGTTTSYSNFVDGNLSNKWQVMKKFGTNPSYDFVGGTEDPAFVEFHADAPIIPKGYVLTYDNSVNENWKPTSWALKAKLNESDDWTTLHSSSSSLGSGSHFEIACNNDGDNEYQYFRFEIYDVGTTMQSILNELQFYGNEYIYYTHLTVTPATCTATGIKQDCYRRSDGKYFTDETGATELAEADVIDPMIPHTGVHHEAGDGNIEYWQCSMCNKYFTDAACTQEVTADEVLKTVFGTLTVGTNGASGYYTLESKTYTLTEDVNTAGYIYVPEGVTATIDLAGHTIDRGLTSAIKNGMAVWVAGSLTVTDSGTGGKIKGGMDSENHVSCVKVYSDNGSPAFTLQGGTLIGNTSNQYDSAVLAPNSSNITISGGKITGDVYGIRSNGHVTVSGGEISGNTYGIYSTSYSVSVSGNPVIANNTSANVMLYYDDASVLTVAGELTDGANIGITKGGGDRPTDNAPVTVTSGYGTYNSNVSPGTYFSLDNDGQIQTGPSEYMTVVMGWNEDRTEIAVGTAMRTVTFDLQGHGSAIEAVSLLSGYKLTRPTEPTAEGWSFGGWYTDEDCTDGNAWNFTSGVTSDMTLYALWTQGQMYRVTLPENMIVVSADNAAVGGKYPTGTNIRFKAAPDYVVDGDVKNGEDVLTADGDGIYTVTVADADITITATVKKAAEPNKTLSGSESYTAEDGDVLTGSTSGTVTIADGASITLSDVTITGGIVCNGTATIALVGTNSVTGATQKAGIQIGGSGTTLTIRGNGSLTANGGQHSAGIGLSRAWNPDGNVIGGDIVIEGGNITANGNSQWGAGIGTGVIYGNGSAKTARIGNITIKGGTVKATGGTDADGIGTGYAYSGCTNAIGTVTIYDGIDKVDASSIKDFANVVYKHGDDNVTASKTDYFAIGEDGNRRLIVQKPVIAEIAEQAYTGSEIKPEPTVTIGSITLTKGEDYEYSYENNINVGTATVRATFQGDYESLGYVEKTFTIKPSTIMLNVTGGGMVTIGDKSASDGEAFGVMSEKGASVVLTLAPESGNTVRSVEYGYTNSSGTTRSGAKLPISDGTATLTVPNDLKDGTGVTLTVTFAAALVGGADEAGAVALTDAAVTDLAGGWYKVESDITFDHTLNLLGDTHLTIADGATMTVSTATSRGIDSDYTLTVGGAGALSVTASGSYQIAVRVGSYVQTGATVTASGFIGIRCCDVFDADVTNDLTFSGGQLTVTGTSDGIWADNTITISCTNASDFIQSSSYEVLSGGTIKVADGKALTDGTNIYTGTLTSEQISAIAGKNLVKKTYEISFVKGDDDASGSMESETVYAETDYTLPACGFTAPENKSFKEWSVVIGEAEAVTKAPDDTINVTANTTVTAVWEDAVVPAFKTHSLVLTGLIGVNFFMDLPEIEGVDYTTSYMEFSLSGTGSAASTDSYNANDMNEAGTYYGFTCYVTSIEMADTITAVFHYTEGGTEKTITQSYSVAQYIADFDAVSSNFSATTIAAVHSLADLGHYVQPVLAAENHWSLGTDHAEMSAYHTGGYDNSEINTVKNAVENYAIVRDTIGSKVAAVTYRLQLDSSTTVSLYLRPESGYEGSIVAYLDGGTSNVAVRQADGRYRIQITDISAHELGYQHTIRVVADKEFMITVYALSYIQTVLNSSTYANNADMINAMVSLYKYYDAVMAYRQQ